jgi:large subunit ribosomal protein L35
VPKQKTNKAAKKRFKVSAGGKLMRRHAMKSHNLEKKSAKRKRAFTNDQPVSGQDAREVKRLLGR